MLATKIIENATPVMVEYMAMMKPNFCNLTTNEGGDATNILTKLLASLLSCRHSHARCNMKYQSQIIAIKTSPPMPKSTS